MQFHHFLLNYIPDKKYLHCTLRTTLYVSVSFVVCLTLVTLGLECLRFVQFSCGAILLVYDAHFNFSLISLPGWQNLCYLQTI